MFRDLEILAISCNVRWETRPWFILFQEGIWAKFVYDFMLISKGICWFPMEYTDSTYK